jgi:polyphenol oxidase
MGYEFGSYGEIGWIGPAKGWFDETSAAVSLRAGGVSLPPFESLNLGRMSGDDPARVAENEGRWASARGIPTPYAKARLVHGTQCITVAASGIFDSCDGLLTDRSGLPLWITVADCVPLFVQAGAWIGLLHCGWRGTADGGCGRLVAALASASSLPGRNQRAWIGPGVGACCYPVGPQVAERFPPEVLRTEGGESRLDLAAAVCSDLLLAGLPARAVDSCGLCTSCRPDLFFSYRRDGARSGRMAAVVWRHG